ncbi:MAG: 23S rRNA (pseudouridine(1915)-N(3))-methyltransferase RlmH [Rhodocyclaceae bacterium]|nr:23S rRNA (pseudouridine(1915)-N(3))-methyltransferase RlmH [Rhodocyclaceae bacterium]MBX3670419.1 23S rRNA (pseudouridine(1915)-N(3))-methyltransferase RlmH [Rhodocyclaceae bacterium]
MKLIVLAVGNRLPDWVNAACSDYCARMTRDQPLQLVEIKPEPRSAGKPVPALLAAERTRIEAQLPASAHVVALDERGADVTTAALAQKLESWRRLGRDVALLIGGPDGLDPALKSAAHETLRLSSLTLPHALARVLLVEALYRAASLNANHPYHRA